MVLCKCYRSRGADELKYIKVHVYIYACFTEFLDEVTSLQGDVCIMNSEKPQ